MSTTYKNIVTKGYESSINNTPIEDDVFRLTIDTRQLFADVNNERLEITDFIKGMTEEEIRSVIAPLPKFYFSSDTHKFLIYNSDIDEWIVCAEANKDTVPKALVADNASTATYAVNASTAMNAINATTASYAINAINASTATYAINANTTINASTATYSTNASSATYADNALNDGNGNQINITYAPLASPIFTGTPTVPTPSSGSNDSQIANTEFVTRAIASIVTGPGFTTVIVNSFDALPETGDDNTIYLIPTSNNETNNYYDEYIWFNESYELIGNTKIDLSGYYNSIEVTGTGNAITNVNEKDGKITFSRGASFLTEHPSVSKSSSTATETPSGGESIEVVDSISLDSYGHLINYCKKTVTLPDNVTNASYASDISDGADIDLGDLDEELGI